MSGTIASAGFVLETAINATSSTLRPASFAARNIRPRTSASTPAASSLVSLVMAAAIGGAMMCRQPRSARKRPLPRLWLMTDERVDDETLLTAIRRLPQGSGIILRHYTLPTHKRRLLDRKSTRLN